MVNPKNRAMVENRIRGAGRREGIRNGRSRNVWTAAFNAKMALAAVNKLQTVSTLASRPVNGQS
jgi:hypothetical protein